MASATPKRRHPRAAAAGQRAAAVGKVRKVFWLDPQTLAEAQDILGTATERDTVEMALLLAGFRKELAAGARVLGRSGLTRID